MKLYRSWLQGAAALNYQARGRRSHTGSILAHLAIDDARYMVADLCKQGKEQLAEGVLLLGKAVLIARLSPADQPGALHAAGWNRTVAALEQWIQDHCLLKLGSQPFSLKDATLVPNAGACADCPKRTGAQPELWPEVKKGDRCLDGECFRKKVTAALERKALKLEAESGKPVLRVAGDYYMSGAPPGTLSPNDYKAIGPKDTPCAHAQMAVVVHGSNRGHTLTVCADKKCKVHGVKLARPGRETPAEKAKREREAALRDGVRLRLQEQLRLDLAEPTDDLLTRGLRLVLSDNNAGAAGLYAVEDMTDDELAALCERRGIALPEGWREATSFDLHGALRAWVEKADLRQLAALMVEVAVADMSYFDTEQVAGAWGLDLGRIEDQVKAGLKAAAKAAADQAKAAKKAAASAKKAAKEGKPEAKPAVAAREKKPQRRRSRAKRATA